MLELREHLLAGRLTLEEFSARVEVAYQARIAQDLAEASRHLPGVANAPGRGVRPTRWTGAVGGHVVKRGRLTLRRRITSLSLFSDLDLDLRDAVLETPEVKVTAVVAAGNIDIYVPDGVNVDVRGVSLFGHRRDTGRVVDRPDAPRIRVRVLSLFATADVWRVPRELEGGYGEIIRRVKDRGRALAR